MASKEAVESLLQENDGLKVELANLKITHHTLQNKVDVVEKVRDQALKEGEDLDGELEQTQNFWQPLRAPHRMYLWVNVCALKQKNCLATVNTAMHSSANKRTMGRR